MALSAAPMARRSQPLTSPAAAPSRNAAIGETPAALRAGPRAETIVAPMPTAAATRIVRAETMTGESGNSAPTALNSALRPNATPTPAAMPIAEDSTPMINASACTERRNWVGSAPTIRSNASSRVR